MNITIEEIESLVTTLETEDTVRRAKLIRLISAYARIIALRSPGKFSRMATEQRDEAGHFDTSYPPKQEYTAHDGPRCIEIMDTSTEDVPTSGRFYYDWKRITEHGGLWVGMRGELYQCTESGTGRLGQFAAHPGDCDVEITLEWDLWSADDLTLTALEQAESTLRTLAFPLASSK